LYWPVRARRRWWAAAQEAPCIAAPASSRKNPAASSFRALNTALADGLDLHSQIKVAHWNIKGLHFAALHPLFETFAVSLANFNDAIAERAVTLGGQAYGTARHVAGSSRIPDYPQDTSKDSDHVRLLAERFMAYLATARSVRDTAEEHEDTTRTISSRRS
jgi:starvation-inducible DNA-binding protein